jgi:hypothetical protein
VLTASADHTARLWAAADGAPVGKPMAHGGLVYAAFSPDGRFARTHGRDGTAILWPIPLPLQGDSKRLVLHVEVQTGCELSEDGFTIRPLDAKAWQERRRQLDAMGEPKGP